MIIIYTCQKSIFNVHFTPKLLALQFLSYFASSYLMGANSYVILFNQYLDINIIFFQYLLMTKTTVYYKVVTRQLAISSANDLSQGSGRGSKNDK